MEPITNEYRAEIIADVARKVGARPEWLDALINFETGGTYDPLTANKLSTAKGLIQFIDASAKDLGFPGGSQQLIETLPYFEPQMYQAVLPYLKMRMAEFGPLNTQQKLYMAVFYPKYINASPQTPFPDSVTKVNPGIRNPQDYIDFVNARIKTDMLHEFPKAIPVIALAAIAGVAWWLYARS